VDFLREALNVLVHSLMEAEVAAQIGAERYERNPERTNQRNGYRQREWHIRVGTLDLSIPKLRKGSYFPSKQSHSHKDLH
jgi:transposase-like protein